MQNGGTVSGGSVLTGIFVDREIGDGDFVDRIGAGDFDDRCGESVGILMVGASGAIGEGGVTGTDGVDGTTGGVADGPGAVEGVLGTFVAASGQICREGSSNSV